MASDEKVKGSGHLAAASLYGALIGGCVTFPYVDTYNQTGRTIELHLVEPPKDKGQAAKAYDFSLIPGKHKRAYFDEIGPDLRISAGSCDYSYGPAVRSMWRKGQTFIALQIEPDFKAHILMTTPGTPTIGQYRDGEAEGFPITPVKTCHERPRASTQTPPNTSAPSQAAASARL